MLTSIYAKKNSRYLRLSDRGSREMSNAKSAGKRAPPRPELDALVEKAKKVVMTEEMLHEQRISFVYGNAPEDSTITKEYVRQNIGKIHVPDSGA